MKANSSKFEIKEIPKEDFFNVMPLFLCYKHFSLKNRSFKLVNINEQNLEEASEKIWKLFDLFAKECKESFSSIYTKQKMKYELTGGFPFCKMPDNTDVGCLKASSPDEPNISYLNFIWLNKEGSSE